MRRLGLVFRHEYLLQVGRWRFWLAAFSVPFYFLLFIALLAVLVWMMVGNKPLGVVDPQHVLPRPLVGPPAWQVEWSTVDLLALDTLAAAEAALAGGEIDSYVALADDFLSSGQARLVYRRQPADLAVAAVEDLVRYAWLADYPAEVADRLVSGPQVILEAENPGAQNERYASLVRIMAPFFGTFALQIILLTTSGYLVQAMVGEKENRTIEIVVTSISPETLMAGKITGLLAVGFTQILLWTSPVLTLYLMLNYLTGEDLLSRLNLGYFWLALGLTLPVLVLMAAIMTAVGASVTEAQEGQQVAGMFSWLFLIPMLLFAPIYSNPNGAIALTLSFLPFTAPQTILMRAAAGVVPTWQFWLSFGIACLAAVGALWLAGRIVRLGMLQTGKRLSWRATLVGVFRRVGGRA